MTDPTESGYADGEEMIAETDLIRLPDHGTFEPNEVHDYIVLPDSATDDDVEYGVPYYAVVNNIKTYGVFVSLTQGDGYDDVGGLVHASKLPTKYNADRFSVQDVVVVHLYDRNEKGLSFELTAVLNGMRGLSQLQAASLTDYSTVPNQDSSLTAMQPSSRSVNVSTTHEEESTTPTLSKSERKLLERVRAADRPIGETVALLDRFTEVESYLETQRGIARGELTCSQSPAESAAARWVAYTDALAHLRGEDPEFDLEVIDE